VRRALPLALLAALACGDAHPDDPVIARLDGAPIRRSEVSAPAAFRLHRNAVESYGVLEEEALRLADERVLADAARRAGTTPEALLARVESEAPPPLPADVERHLAERGVAADETARARVRHYLAERARIERRLAFLAELRVRAGYEWLLPKPAQPRARIDAPRAPARGPAGAPVAIVHFASFASPESARSAEALAELAAERPGELRWLHVNFARADEPTARRAARLGFAAQDAGRFWELHDALFAQGGRLDDGALAAAARAAGVPETRADDDALDRRVDDDFALAKRAGALREPTIFVNGRYWSGRGGAAGLRRLVEEERERALDALHPGG
jgi:2-hydroxychromene-2-carboxylate isomerase